MLFAGLVAEERDFEKSQDQQHHRLIELEAQLTAAERELSMSKLSGSPEVTQQYEALIDTLTAAVVQAKARVVSEVAAFEQTALSLAGVKRAYDKFFTIIELKDVLISGVSLPPTIKAAIESKLEQEQVAKEFDFRLERERKEAERKRIEARGIRDFQDMIAAGIEEGLLKWKAIEATLELAESENAKMIIIGAGEEGLPVILGNQGWDSTPPVTPDTTAAP